MDGFLRLPRLRTLKIWGLFDDPRVDWMFPPRTSELEELHLSAAYLHGHNLAILIESCKALRKLVYSSDFSPAHGATLNPHLRYPHIKTALDGHASSLCELRIQTCTPWGPHTAWSPSEKIDSFSFYHQLTHFTFPAYALIPTNPELFGDQLPPNLETLCLDETPYEHFGDTGIEALESLLRSPHYALRSLKEVYLEREITRSLLYDNWKVLRNSFAEKDITLRMWDLGRTILADDDWFHIAYD